MYLFRVIFSKIYIYRDIFSSLNHTFLQKTGISVADLSILILQAVGIQEKIVDAHRQDAVIVVQRRRSM